MSTYLPRVEQAILRCSPFYLRAERLRMATAVRREALPDSDTMSWWRGAGTYAAVTYLEDSRFYPGRPPASAPVRVALRTVATLAQGAVGLAAAPYCGVLVGLAYLRGGETAAMDQAARHFLPLYVGLLALHVAMWVTLGFAFFAVVHGAASLRPPGA